MHKPDSVVKNETHEIIWDFEIQTDPLIPTRRSELVIVNHTTKYYMHKPESVQENETKNFESPYPDQIRPRVN